MSHIILSAFLFNGLHRSAIGWCGSNLIITACQWQAYGGRLLVTCLGGCNLLPHLVGKFHLLNVKLYTSAVVLECLCHILGQSFLVNGR